MRYFRMWQIGAGIGFGFFAAVALADGPGAEVATSINGQDVSVTASAGNPAVVAVKASGPAVNAVVDLQSQSGDCLDVVSHLYPGLCVPIGPGLPVSPN
jgi:hypothetical protein